MLNATGLRTSEAVSLRWDDVNHDKKTIVVGNTKGKRREEITLTSETEEILEAIEYEEEKIFNYKNTDSLKAIKRQLQRFGFTFHDFRRTFGTRWSKQLEPFELKKIMRHKDIRTTDKFYVYNELSNIKAKMNGCYLVAESNKKCVKKYKIRNANNKAS